MKKIGKQPIAVFLLLTFLWIPALGVSLIPVGRTAGIEMQTKGAVVVQLSPISGGTETEEPAAQAGLQPGDVLCSLDGKSVTSNGDLQNALQEIQGKTVQLQYLRDGTKRETQITPAKTQDGSWRLGILVRDRLTGIGTITYVNPADGSYASLGHGICDTETGALLPLQSGYLTEAAVTGVTKGKSGEPGELEGEITEESIGSIEKNTEKGIFGVFSQSQYYQNLQAVETGEKKAVHTGKVTILSNVSGTKTQGYAAEIVQLYPEHDKEGRSFMLKITDPELLEQTGGIVQGMSGSPILQDGKLIGAVTHVLVNDPTRGYGIYIEKMLTEQEK